MLDPGQTINSNDQTTCLRRLNFIAKRWQGNADMAQGLKIHTRQRVTVFLAKNQQTYLVGPAASDNNATTTYGRTTLSAAEAAGQTVLSVTATTDTTTYPGTTVTMTGSDYIGIQQTDGTLFWTTIASTGAGTVTVDDALSVGGASGAYVYWYTSKAQRFPVCESAVLRNASIVDVGLPVYVEARQYDVGISNKTQTGDPIHLLIEPLRLNTRVTTDFLPQDVTKQLRLTVLYPSEDYDATTDDIAFPQEWFDALHWELAKSVHSIFGVQWTAGMAENHITATAIARELNPQNSAAYFQPGKDDF